MGRTAKLIETKASPEQILVMPEGVVEGYAAVFNNVDSLGDITEPGAFTKTLSEHAEFPLCFFHDIKRPIGMAKCWQDEIGLRFRGELDLNTQAGREAYSGAKAGYLCGVSFRFIAHKKAMGVLNGHRVRLLKELAVEEITLATTGFQINKLATVDTVKAIDLSSPSLVVHEVKALPVSTSSRAWNGTAARERVMAWATVDGVTDWERVGEAFLCHCASETKSMQDYQLQIADIVNQKLVMIPHAVMAAATCMGSTTAEATQRESLRTLINGLYGKINKPAPFADPTKGAKAMTTTGSTDFTTNIKQEQEEKRLWDQRYLYNDQLRETIDAALGDTAKSYDERLALIGTILDQYGEAMKDWAKEYVAAGLVEEQLVEDQLAGAVEHEDEELEEKACSTLKSLPGYKSLTGKAPNAVPAMLAQPERVPKDDTQPEVKATAEQRSTPEPKDDVLHSSDGAADLIHVSELKAMGPVSLDDVEKLNTALNMSAERLMRLYGVEADRVETFIASTKALADTLDELSVQQRYAREHEELKRRLGLA